MTLRLKLINWITRWFPSEAATFITTRLHLVKRPTPPRLMTINKYGFYLATAVLLVGSWLLLVGLIVGWFS